MSAAAVTPRVRSIVLCDEVFASTEEEDVFSLERVRLNLRASVVPWRARLSLFIILSCARVGEYSGRVLIFDQRTEKLIRYTKFSTNIGKENALLPLWLDLGRCAFPDIGM